MTSDNIYLNDGVYIREVDAMHIILDARSDKYFLLDREKSSWLAEIKQGTNATSPSKESKRFTEWLLKTEFLTVNPQVGKPIESIIRPEPVGSIHDSIIERPNTPKIKEFLTFTSSFLNACILRNTRSFQYITNITRNRKNAARANQKYAPSTEYINNLVSCFNALSPVFFTTKDACFFNSLLLVDFLRRYGISADWEFGVRLSPFAAHCWVEHDSIILNDYYDHAREYKKIMSI